VRETEQRPRDVADVVADLTEIGQRLAPGDGVGAFNGMYLLVTELVGRQLHEGYFADPGAMTALDVTFAGLYLAAVEAATADERVPQAWRPLFARRHDPAVLPIQFAIAGMNAHINHDLPVAVVATCRAIGKAPDEVHADYLKVNALLASVERQVRESFENGVVRDADRAAARVLDRIGAWSIDSARDAAWVNADVLWRLRDAAFAARAFEDTLAGTVGLATATLLTPV
jgi:hypothetical protein